MGLFDVVKELLGDSHPETSGPSMADITIISTDALSQTSESQSEPVQG
jgi:hypothetical protein